MFDDLESYQRVVQSIRLVPTNQPHYDYPGSFLIMFGPTNEGPTDLYDVLTVIKPSTTELDGVIYMTSGLAGNFAWHPSEGGLIISGFVSQRSVDQSGASTLLFHFSVCDVNPEGTKIEVVRGDRQPMGVVTPQGDGSFRIDLFGDFYFLVTQLNEEFHPSCGESWHAMSWEQYLAENPIITPVYTWRNQLRDTARRRFFQPIYEIYSRYIGTPFFNWRIRRRRRAGLYKTN